MYDICFGNHSLIILHEKEIENYKILSTVNKVADELNILPYTDTELITLRPRTDLLSAEMNKHFLKALFKVYKLRNTSHIPL